MKRKAVFFDRDGVINEVVWRENTPASPRTISEFIINNDVSSVMLYLKGLNYKIFVVTNQPDISRKLMDISELESMHENLMCNFPIDEIEVCPHDNQDNCYCRKPKPGMLNKLADKWSINLQESFIIGDSWKDIEAGNAAQCKTVLINTSYNQDVNACFRINKIEELLNLIKL